MIICYDQGADYEEYLQSVVTTNRKAPPSPTINSMGRQFGKKMVESSSIYCL